MEFRVDAVLVGTVPVSGTGVYATPCVITNAAGNHTIAPVFVSSNPYFQGSSGSNTLSVSREDASVTPFTGNPMAVQVSTPGGTSSPFTLQADINEIADETLGGHFTSLASFDDPYSGSSGFINHLSSSSIERPR